MKITFIFIEIYVFNEKEFENAIKFFNYNDSVDKYDIKNLKFFKTPIIMLEYLSSKMLIQKLEFFVLDTVSNPEAHFGLEVVAFWFAVDPEEIRHPKRMRHTKLRQLPMWLQTKSRKAKVEN